MHEHAELGVAAHWQYKEGRKAEAQLPAEDRLAAAAARAQASRDGAEPDLLGGLQAELFEDRVYALSPRGEVVDLPKGATPLDFAYHVHTDLGHRCRGANVNGRMVPLNHRARERRHCRDHPGKQPHPEPRLAGAAARIPGVGAQPGQGARLVPQAGRGPEPRAGPPDARARARPARRARAVRCRKSSPSSACRMPKRCYLGLGSGEITLAQVAGAMQRRMQERERATRRVLQASAAEAAAGAWSSMASAIC